MNAPPLTIEELNRRFFSLCRRWGIVPPIPEEETRERAA